MDSTCDHGKDPARCPDCRLARSRDRAAKRLEETSRLEKIAHAPSPLPAAAPIKVEVDIVEERDRVILSALNRRGGLAMVHQLRRELPVGDPARSDDDQADQAVKNSLMRLKAKRKVARTGDTWSIVGIGMAASI